MALSKVIGTSLHEGILMSSSKSLTPPLKIGTFKMKDKFRPSVGLARTRDQPYTFNFM